MSLKDPSFAPQGFQPPQRFPKHRGDIEGEGYEPRERREAREGCTSVEDLESIL